MAIGLMGGIEEFIHGGHFMVLGCCCGNLQYILAWTNAIHLK